MQILEHRLGEPLEDVLRRLYLNDKKTVKQVAAELGVSTASVSTWMARFGIEARYVGSRASEEPTQ